MKRVQQLALAIPLAGLAEQGSRNFKRRCKNVLPAGIVCTVVLTYVQLCLQHIHTVDSGIM